MIMENDLCSSPASRRYEQLFRDGVSINLNIYRSLLPGQLISAEVFKEMQGRLEPAHKAAKLLSADLCAEIRKKVLKELGGTQ